MGETKIHPFKRWRESRKIKFLPVDCKSPFRSNIQWHINKTQWLKILSLNPTKHLSVKFFDESKILIFSKFYLFSDCPLFTLRAPFCTEDGSFYARAGERFTAIRELLSPPENETEDRLFEGFFGEDQKFTFNFEIYESNLKIDKSKTYQNSSLFLERF